MQKPFNKFNRRVRIILSETRIIFLIGNYAYKFPRIKLLWLCTSVYRLIRQGRSYYKHSQRIVAQKYETPTGTASLRETIAFTITNTIVPGFVANRKEYALWQKTKSENLVPTYYMFAGLCVVQPRAQQYRSLPKTLYCAAHEERSGRIDPLDAYADNWGFWNNKPVWLDYAQLAAGNIPQITTLLPR